ncbi:MAG: FAD-binding protein [Myxococcales bacterium]|nr:FAD-binding protein [Myxococcales bacterium]
MPAPASVERAALELSRRLGESKVMAEGDGRAAYGADESEVEAHTPDIVVFASRASDVATTLAVAAECDVPVTPRAGGSSRVGGAVPVAGGIVLATHGMNTIKEIDPVDLVAVVEPGVMTAALHAAAEAEGLFYPPDPNSLKWCMLGGNVAANAGGPRAFKYGVTREYVLGVEACLMGGHVHRPGRRTIKGVAGYDVTALLVGSEGTLGVFSELTLRLRRAPEAVVTAMALYADVHAAAAAVNRVLASGAVPRCMELMDSRTLGAVRAQKVAVDVRANAMLLVELDGDAASVERELEKVGGLLSEGPAALDVLVAQDEAQRERLWEARRMLSPATKKLARHKLSEDVVVPRSQIGALLRATDAIGERHRVMHLTYGHAGDGNLHVNFLWNDDEERVRVDGALLDLMTEVVRLRGTISGEHGIGVTKLDYLPLEQTPALIDLQREIKRVFDPKGLLNPGKIFAPSGHGSC